MKFKNNSPCELQRKYTPEPKEEYHTHTFDSKSVHKSKTPKL